VDMFVVFLSVNSSGDPDPQESGEPPLRLEFGWKVHGASSFSYLSFSSMSCIASLYSEIRCD
jgi:hypothetical protein